MSTKVDLLGGSYQQKYMEYNSQRTINWLPIVSTQQEKNKSQTALFPRAGLTSYVSLPGRYGRGIYTARTPLDANRCFAVVDYTLYEILTNGTYTTIGTMPALGTGSTKIYMTCNSSNQVGIFGYNAGYYFDMVANTLTQITTNQYPGTVEFADYMDGYTVVVSAGATYYNPNSALQTWSLLDVFTPTFQAAPCKACLTFRDEIFNFTSKVIEPYYNDGTDPFSRVPNSTILVGLVSKESLVKFNDGFIFLGRGFEGEAQVFRYDGYYNCLPFPDTSINWRLNSKDINLDDVYGHIQYTKEGHILYRLTVPDLKTTFVFDLSTQTWSEASSLAINDSDGSNNYNEFRARHYTNFKGMNLFLDTYSGTVFIEDYASVTDNGNTIRRVRRSQPYSQNYQSISITNIELDCNTGYGLMSNPGSTANMMISISRDGGYNYEQPRNLSLGNSGDHLYRARMNRLGTARNWVVELVVTDPTDLMINNAIVKGDIATY